MTKTSSIRLEQYSWRAQEAALNAELPQFRISIALAPNASLASSDSPRPSTADNVDSSTRIHFVHVRSSKTTAVPLLLIPPFPFTNLSLGHIIKALVGIDPESKEHPTQAFHIVCPSLPGLGFSDGLPSDYPVIATSASVLDSLMRRLGYSVYLASCAGLGSSSPAQIDWKIANCLAKAYADSCVGVHLISPPFEEPRFRHDSVEWVKWKIARRLGRPVLGYESWDMAFLNREVSPSESNSSSSAPLPLVRRSRPQEVNHQSRDTARQVFDPNALAYAFCDSPIGLLVLILKLLRDMGSQHEFSSSELLTLTLLAWLPGPEGILRTWARCENEDEDINFDKNNNRKRHKSQSVTPPKGNTNLLPNKKQIKPTVSLTVFMSDSNDTDNKNPTVPAMSQPSTSNVSHYTCPRWGRSHFNILHTNRVAGTPGLLMWQRPEVIVDGIRALAKAMVVIDTRLNHVSSSSVTPDPTPSFVKSAADASKATSANQPSSTGSSTATTTSPATLLTGPSNTIKESPVLLPVKARSAILESVPEENKETKEAKR